MDASEADEEDPLDAFMAGIDAEVRTASAAPPPRREEEEEVVVVDDNLLSLVGARAAGKAGVASARAPPPPRGFVRASADEDRFPAGPLSAPPRSDAAYSARPDDLAPPPPGSLPAAPLDPSERPPPDPESGSDASAPPRRLALHVRDAPEIARMDESAAEARGARWA